MNLDEAYSILELPKGSSKEDATKKFRELSKKYHPDNKKTGNEAFFKKLNEAHQIILNPPQPQQMPFSHGHQGGFNPFRTQHHFRVVEQVDIGTNLTFEESVLGCNKKISYQREVKCVSCEGEGVTFADTGCVNCNGTGRVMRKQANTIFIQTCTVCNGKRGEAQKCTDCEGDGVAEATTEVSIRIPGGVTSNTVIRLGNKGNYAGSFGPMDQYSDAFLHLEVASDPDLSIEDDLVVSRLNISLLEAIRGCQKSVRTVAGTKEIIVSPLAKNKDEIIIPHVGINGTGPQKVILNVEYPKDTALLINALQESK